MGFGYSKKLFGGAGGGGGGGITNSAGANVIPKSDGTNLVASGLSETGAGRFSIYGSPATSYSSLLSTDWDFLLRVNYQDGVGTTYGFLYDQFLSPAAVLRGIPGIPAYLRLYDGANSTYLRQKGEGGAAWGIASATPQAYTHSMAADASSADTSGANAVLTPGIGRGNAAGSTLTISTPDPVASGSTEQTVSPRMSVAAGGITFNVAPIPASTDSTVNGAAALQWASVYVSRGVFGSKTKTLTESSATGFVDIAVTAGQRISGEVIYEVYAADATDFQTITGRLRYAAVNKAGTTTVTVSEVGTQTTAVSAGTLTATNTAADTTNKITLSCNAVSSLTQTTLEIRYRIDSVSTNTITPL